jgi:1-deoxy-D-xylulose-5-phosphate synthase
MRDLSGLEDAQLSELFEELRREVVARTGVLTDISSAVVKMTIAVHAVFDMSGDKLIWGDSSGACAHNVLMGKRAGMRNSHGKNGPVGPAQEECPVVGDPAAAISAALGFAIGRELGQQTGDSIAVIDDTDLGSGIAYEALNNAGALGQRLFVILNDTSPKDQAPAKAVSKYLAGLMTDSGWNGMPDGPQDHLRRSRQLITGTMSGEGTLFGELGFDYVGPVDGRDILQLVNVLRAVRTRAVGPVLIHCRTFPGGTVSGQDQPTLRKSKVPLRAKTPPRHIPPAYEDVFGETFARLAVQDRSIVGVTAEIESDTGLAIPRKTCPDRIFDVGAADRHAVTFAAGLAMSGLRPFCVLHSGSLQRGYNQIVQDVVPRALPVRFALRPAESGPVHKDMFDIGVLAALPHLVLMAAADEAELVHMVTTAAAYDSGPVAFHFPAGPGMGVTLPTHGEVLEIGKGRVLFEGEDIALLSFGGTLGQSAKAARLIADAGVSVTLADARFVRPLDRDLVRRLARDHRALITVEQGTRGGFGAMVLHDLAQEGLLDRGLAIRTMTLPDQFVTGQQDTATFADTGLAAADIAATALQAIGVRAKGAPGV